MTLEELRRAVELLPPGSALTIAREPLLEAMNGNGAAPTTAPSTPEPDRLLSVREAAAILGLSPEWLYRHAKALPFTRRLSRKALRFSEPALRRWIEHQR